MKDDMKPLEEELARLRPRPLSSACVKRLLEIADVEAPQVAARGDANPGVHYTHTGNFRRFLALGAAAVLAASLGLALLQFTTKDGGKNRGSAVATRTTHAKQSVSEDRPESVSAGLVLYGMRDEGTTMTENGRPARKVRLFLVEQTQWEAVDDGAEFEAIRLREQIVYIALPVL